MDYLDPKKQFRHTVLLFTGYILITIAIGIATVVLLNLAYGYQLKNGTVIQKGRIFLSSQPRSANISIDGKPPKAKTNTSLELAAGIYQITLSRSGYRNWQRSINLQGGSLIRFNYPLLVPTTLKTTSLKQYSAAPGLATQSPDRRWLLVQQAGSQTVFDLFDLKAPAKAPTTLTLPANLLTAATSSESWQLVSWADDNDHVLLQHLYDGRSEYILIDRTNPDQSQNVSQVLGISADPIQLTLANEKFDQYLMYNTTTLSLERSSLSTPAPVPLLEHILAFQSYGDSTYLYVTDNDAPAGKVIVRLLNGGKTYTIRSFNSGTTYLVDLTKYSDKLYVAAGAAAEDKVYIYRDPIAQLNAGPDRVTVPVQVLHVTQPNYLSFSTNTQFIVAEGGQQFGVYDIENANGYNYTETAAVDKPQVHATWMDGDRLAYVSGGKEMIFDYDDTNRQTLVAAAPSYLPFFQPDYRAVYTLAPSPGSQYSLGQTSLLIPADQ